MSNDKKIDAVKKTYAEHALSSQEESAKKCCCSSGCGTSNNKLTEYASLLGYSQEELKMSSGANLGLGCGNPTAIATLKEGEHVLDLGSGGGFDCFIASKKVGQTGRVVGVDMTQEMIDLANKNAQEKNIKNVEFVLGQIEDLSFADDGLFDVVISNCVINLSVDKKKVLSESARVLKSGGRFIVSDVIATREIPQNIRDDLALYTGCMAGATPVEELKNMMIEAGFDSVKIEVKEDSRSYIGNWAPNSKAEDYVASAIITAYKK